MTENGQCFIHPFDDAQIIAGAGTLGLEMLEAAVRTWTGTLIVASHDRWLIEHWWGRRLHLR